MCQSLDGKKKTTGRYALNLLTSSVLRSSEKGDLGLSTLGMCVSLDSGFMVQGKVGKRTQDITDTPSVINIHHI